MTLNDLLGGNDAAWMRDKRRPCATGNPDDWFPRERYELPATKLCDGCPLATKDACLQYAIDEGLDHGIFGGLTPAQRVIVRRRQQRRALRAAKKGAAA